MTATINTFIDMGYKHRFNFDAVSIDEAEAYISARAKQLLRHFFKLKSMRVYDWGVSALFDKDGQVYQSLYILKDYRGLGLFPQNQTHRIVTSTACDIEPYLRSKKIDYVCVNLCPFGEYRIISDYYGAKTAERSGVQLMNHIDEGLFVLERLNASVIAKKAFCLHPMLQSDEALAANHLLLNDIEPQVLIALMEYRSVANDYLSNRTISSVDEIRLSPLKDVNDMLIADKVQNKKDFELYHKGVHPRSSELELYFDNWLERLNVSDAFYEEVRGYCS